MLDTGCSILDARYWMRDAGRWMLDMDQSPVPDTQYLIDTDPPDLIHIRNAIEGLEHTVLFQRVHAFLGGLPK